jgi:hypothetical protein
VSSSGQGLVGERLRAALQNRIPIEIPLVDAAEPPVYLQIAEKASHLRELRMSDNAIARALGVSDNTVAKAIERWGSTASST